MRHILAILIAVSAEAENQWVADHSPFMGQPYAVQPIVPAWQPLPAPYAADAFNREAATQMIVPHTGNQFVDMQNEQVRSIVRQNLLQLENVQRNRDRR